MRLLPLMIGVTLFAIMLVTSGCYGKDDAKNDGNVVEKLDDTMKDAGGGRKQHAPDEREDNLR